MRIRVEHSMPTGGSRPASKGKKRGEANLGNMQQLYGGKKQEVSKKQEGGKKENAHKKQDGGKKRVAQKGGCGCANIVLPH